MQELRLVAVSEDGTYLVLATAGRGTRFTLPVDDRLRAAVRGNFSRLGQYEIEVESPLRPKEIQARIRAGETAEEIAATAGIPVERVRWFEGPVLQEREYVAQQAQRAAVRMPGESSSGPVLGDLVAERLNRRGVPTDEIDWDSAKRDDGLWRVKLGYVWNGHTRHAEWLFDPRRRHVSPHDDEAIRLSSADFDPDPVVEDTTVTPFTPRVAKLQPVPPLTSDPLPFPSVIRQQDHEEPAAGYEPQARGSEAAYPPSYEVPPPTPAMEAPYDRSPARGSDPAPPHDNSRASGTHLTEPPVRETGRTRPGETVSRRGGSSPWLPDFGQSRDHESRYAPRPSSPASQEPARPDRSGSTAPAAPIPAAPPTAGAETASTSAPDVSPVSEDSSTPTSTVEATYAGEPPAAAATALSAENQPGTGTTAATNTAQPVEVTSATATPVAETPAQSHSVTEAPVQPQPIADDTTPTGSATGASDTSSIPEAEPGGVASDPEPQTVSAESAAEPQTVSAESAEGVGVQAAATSATDAHPSQETAGQEVTQAPSPTAEAATSPAEVTSHAAETRDHTSPEAPATTSEKSTVTATDRTTPAADDEEAAPPSAEAATPAVPEKDTAPAEPQWEAASQKQATPAEEATPAATKEAAPAAPPQDAEPATAGKDAPPQKEAAEPEAKAEPVAKAKAEGKGSGSAGSKPVPAARPSKEDETKEKPAAKEEPPVPVPSPPPAPAARQPRKSSRGRRASVPTWDEIMFGARRQD